MVVTIGPNGLTVISDDPAALDEFERLLQVVACAGSAGPLVPVFYLKYAKAAAAAESLERIFGESAAGGDSSSGTAATNSVHRLASGPIKIIPDPRLNALLIQANRADLEKIKQVLQVLDMKESPEDVSVSPKPRMIPVSHTRAQDVADVLKEVYADRLVVPSTGNQVTLRFGGGRSGRFGGFGGFGGPFGGFGGGFGPPPGGNGSDSGQTKRDEANRIGVGVDARTNSVIVTATDPVFEEIKQLVGELDVAASEQELDGPGHCPPFDEPRRHGTGPCRPGRRRRSSEPASDRDWCAA